MERTAFTLLKEMEASWWYKGRSEAVLAAVKHAGLPKASSLLDYGAGYGGMEETCAKLATVTDAFEPDTEARTQASSRDYRTTFADEETALAKQYDRIVLFDVLEHIEDDQAFLTKAKQSLTSEGRLVITVPAFPALWSQHDVEHHHFRRYTAHSLRKALTESGYEVDYLSYWNCSLSIPASVLRFLGKGGEAGLTPPRFINSILSAVVSLEALFLRFIPLPFGLSLVVVARMPKAPMYKTFMTKVLFLARYGIAGITGGVIQTLYLYLWVSVFNFKEGYLVGLVLGFIIALIVSFLLQKYWAFRDHAPRKTKNQLLSYTLVALSGLALNALLLAGAKSLFEAAGVNFFAGWYLLAQIVITVIVAFSNFGLNFLITFRHARKERSWER